MRKKWVVVAVVAAAVLVAGTGVVWFAGRDDGPGGTVRAYLAAWQRGDARGMRALAVGAPADLAARQARTRTDLGVTAQRYTAGRVAPPDGDRATAAFQARLTLSGGHVWTYTGALALTRRDGEWRVRWSPATVYPGLRDGQRLRAARSWPDPAPVRAADGSSLAGSTSGSARELAGDLRRQYAARLTGTPALAVQIAGAGGTPVRTLARFGGRPGTALPTTIDPRTQEAAGRALADVDKPASLVAIRPSTGEILAVANKPGGYDRALLGHYPPGSTFKVVTAAALVAGGMRPADRVACPATTAIGGRTFKNDQYEDFGTITLRDAFAHSCNTTFARLSVDRLSRKRLAAVAAQFGFGTPIVGGLPAVRASFPAPADDTSFAAASFGQGEVLTSPLNMAAVAAAAAGGTWHTPRVVSPALAARAADAHGAKPAPPRRLEPAVRRALKSLMPAVVSEGTAAGVAFPSGTAGKTGTAEYGSGPRPPTHAWFIGYRGDLAFAVLVEGGGTGAGAAAPVAARFLRER